MAEKLRAPPSPSESTACIRRASANAPRQRADGDERAERTEPSLVVDGAVGGLEAHEAAERRGNADRSAAVRPEAEGAHARGNRRCGAAAGTAGGAERVEGIRRVGTQQVVGGGRLAEFRHVGLADEDRPGTAQPANGARVVRHHVVGVRQRTERGDVTLDVKGVLDRDRDAGERAGSAVAIRRLCGDRLTAGQLRRGKDDRIQQRVDLCDALLRLFADLDR